MKITDVKVWLVEGIKYNWTLLKIFTDERLTGVGEANNWPGSPIIYHPMRHPRSCHRMAVAGWGQVVICLSRVKLE